MARLRLPPEGMRPATVANARAAAATDSKVDPAEMVGAAGGVRFNKWA
jgi:hypothetical protein